MLTDEEILAQERMGDLLERFPYLDTFFAAIRIDEIDENKTFIELLNGISDQSIKEFGKTKRSAAREFVALVHKLQEAQAVQAPCVSGLSIVGGTDKKGRCENLKIELFPGEVVCIVGPTGCGKSQLLADVECRAQGDTVTKRVVEIAGTNLPRSNVGLIAQISQHMNFVIDMSVREFIEFHAECLGIADDNRLIDQVLECANALSGEQFDPSVPVVNLSGGQARALMVADTAFVSNAPIVLIDEIENAGLDRLAALNYLIGSNKIVLIATHDPLIALMCARRIVIAEGGIVTVSSQCDADRRNVDLIASVDRKLRDLRMRIRNGSAIEELPRDYFSNGED